MKNASCWLSAAGCGGELSLEQPISFINDHCQVVLVAFSKWIRLKKKVSQEVRLAKPNFLLIHLSHFLAQQQPQFPSKVLHEHQSTAASPQQSIG